MKIDAIINSNSLNLNEFLKNSYENIWKSIEKEGYIIDYQDFNEFYEIKNEEANVVGFIALEKSTSSNTKTIVDCYILPEHRGEKLLYKYLITLVSNTSYNIFSKKPNRNFMLALLSYGLAFKLTPDLVVSWIDFEISLDDVYKNSKIKRLYKKVDEEYKNISCKADLFDLNINCTLFQDSNENVSKNSNTFVISEPRKYDLKKHNSRKKLKQVTVKYIENVDFAKDDNLDELIEYFNELNMDLNKYYSVDNIIGSENELKEDFVELLNKNHLSFEDGFKIRKDIIKALDIGEIIPSSIKFRLEFLANHREYIGKVLDDYDEDMGCPFCEDALKGAFYTCDNCGHKFESIRTPMEIMEDAFDIFDDSDESIDEILENELFSIKNFDFVKQFFDLNQKFEEFVISRFDLSLDEIIEGDIPDINHLSEDEDFKENDWGFKEGNNLDNEILKIIEEKNYDEYEVYEAQSRISVYECVKHINENLTSWKMDIFHDLNHILFDRHEYAINNGYLKKLKDDEFRNYLNNYSLEDLQKELYYFDMQIDGSKQELIEQLFKISSSTYAVTEKGLQYLKDYPVLDFFAEYLPEFIFYEFEKYHDEYKDKLSIEEISQNFINAEFKNAFKTGKFDVYINYLYYFYKINYNNENYDEALVYLIQRVIYEINKWYMVDNLFSNQLVLSVDTALLFNQIIDLNMEFDLDELFDKAFKEFKFGHMKNHRSEIEDYVIRLLDGEHVMDINEELSGTFFNGILNRD